MNALNIHLSIKIIVVLVLLLLAYWIIPTLRYYRSFNGSSYIMQSDKYEDITHQYSIYKASPRNLKFVFDPYLKAVDIFSNTNLCIDSKKKEISIVEVESSCGKGCGELGGDIIEIEEARFKEMMNSHEEGKVDHLIFYELGRLFWNFTDQLNYYSCHFNHTMHTGYAIFMRTVIMEKLSYNYAPINGLKFDEYVKSLDSIYTNYISLNMNFHNTISNNNGLPNFVGADPPKIFAAILFHLYRIYGDKIFIDLWCEVYHLSPTNSCNDIIDNFFVACCYATDSDLTNWFINVIKWPVSEKYRNFYQEN